MRFREKGTLRLGLGWGSLLSRGLLRCSLLGSRLLGGSGLSHRRLGGRRLRGSLLCGSLCLGGSLGLLSRALAAGSGLLRGRSLLGWGLAARLAARLATSRRLAARGRALLGGSLLRGGRRRAGSLGSASLGLRLGRGGELVRGLVLDQSSALNTALQGQTELHAKHILVHRGMVSLDVLGDGRNAGASAV